MPRYVKAGLIAAVIVFLMVPACWCFIALAGGIVWPSEEMGWIAVLTVVSTFAAAAGTFHLVSEYLRTQGYV